MRKLSQRKTLLLISKAASVGSDEPAFHSVQPEPSLLTQSMEVDEGSVKILDIDHH